MEPLSASKTWQPLFKFARSVSSFELDQNAIKEANQIPPSVFVRLAQQVKGEPLFPNLSTIELKNFDTSAPYLPLLVSPCLREISVELTSRGQLEQAAISPSCEQQELNSELTLSVLLDDWASASPALQSLKLKNIPDITCLTQDLVSRFRHLRVLELTNFNNVEGFTGFLFLDSLASLEDLSIVATSTKYISLVSSINTRETYLPSLKCFCVDAPLEIMLDFLQSIASVNLEHLTFNHRPSVRRGVFAFGVPRRKRVKVQSVPPNFLKILFSRWPLSLKKLTIVSSTDMECDFHYLTRLQVLENLSIQGCSTSGIYDFFVEPSSFRTNALRSLSLTGASIPLRLLKQIAEYAPSLITLSLSLDIHETSYADETRMTNHPLQSLEIHHHDVVNHNPEMNSDNFLQLIRMARYLNALFPGILSLTSSTSKSDWEKVWQLVKLCQDSRHDEKAGS